jgi:hypothetical protein
LTLAAVAPIEPPKLGIPVADLLTVEIDPIEWLVPGYIQEQSICVLAGPPNAGKTLLAADWCAKLVARGKRVFIGQNEGGLRGLQQRLKRACIAADIPSPRSDLFTYRRNVEVALSDLHGVKLMAKQLEFYDLIVLDSLSSFWPGLDENKPEHMSIVAEALKTLCEFSGAAVLGNHHTTKAAWKAGEKPSLGDIRGHGAMAGRIDGAFICKPMERVAGVVRFELHVVKQRDEEWTPPRAVEVLMTGDAATVTMDAMPGRGMSMARPTDHRERELEQQVLLVLPEDENQAVAMNAICTKVRKAKPDVVAAVKRLYQGGRIQQDWNGRFYRMKALPSDSGKRTPSMFRPYQPPGDDDDDQNPSDRR